MKKSRFTEEQIVGILRETDRDPVATTVAKRHGVSEQAIYTWKKRFGSFEPDDVRRLKQGKPWQNGVGESFNGKFP